MASVDILQYQPHTSAFNNFSHDRDPPLPPAFFDNILPPPRSTTFPLWTSSSAKNAVSINVAAPPGTAIAANVVSNHGKLHKRGVPKSTRKKLKREGSQHEFDIVLTRTRTPPSISAPTSTEGQRSPSKSITRELFKQNLRKLSSNHHDDYTQSDTLDLSRTAEENEERSGLDITISNVRSKSQSDLCFPAGNTYRGHTRSHSHNSVISTSSGVYHPTVPFVLPMRDASIAYTPSTTRPPTAAMEEIDPAGSAYFAPDIPIRPRGTTLNSTSSAGEKPRLRLNTSASFARLANNSQTAFSITGSPVRTRRCTNQSMQSADAPTPKSRASADRTFTFHSKNKEEPVDSATRAANIQAARQAFEDRQEAKAKKYEDQEQKALRKQARHEDRKQRRQSDGGGGATRASIRASSVPRSEKFESGGEYEAAEPRAGHHHHPLRDEIGADLADTRPGQRGDVQKISKKRAAKSRYIRFVSWLKTKFLHMGRSQ